VVCSLPGRRAVAVATAAPGPGPTCVTYANARIVNETKFDEWVLFSQCYWETLY
jgi:hypothetical protein